MLRQIFPSLFEFATLAVNYSDVVVSRSNINPETCVIIKARKPLDWLLDHCAIKDMPMSWIDAVELKFNTDGSLSVIEK